MAGEINTLITVIKSIAKQTIESDMPMNFCIGEVVNEEYAPLQIKVKAFSDVLEEDDLILTNAVKDHWQDVEVYMETVDDDHLGGIEAGGLKESERNIINNMYADHHSGIQAAYNDICNIFAWLQTTFGMSEFDYPNYENYIFSSWQLNSDGDTGSHKNTSHLHNIQGRKRIRVYNGLHKGEKVVMLRCAGGQEYIVLDRLTDQLSGGEWRTEAAASIENQQVTPYEVTDAEVLKGWKNGASSNSEWPNAAKPDQYEPGADGPK